MAAPAYLRCAGAILVAGAALCYHARAEAAEAEPYIDTIFLWAGQVPEPHEDKCEQPLMSDRPDFTEASSVVGKGLTQVELGYTVFHDRGGDTEALGHSYPEALFRIGMFREWFEARIAFNYGTDSVSLGGIPQSESTGGQDLYVGVKLALTLQDGWLPEMALVPQMTLPTGSEEHTAHECLPGVNWLYGWDVIENISTAGSTQYNEEIDEDGTQYGEFAQSWTIGYTLGEHLGGYTEVFALMPCGASTAKPEYYFDGGLTFPITKNLQFDVRAGVGLNSAADDFFAGTGAAIRF